MGFNWRDRNLEAEARQRMREAREQPESTSRHADFLQKAQEVAELIVRNTGTLIEREALN